MTPWKTSFPSQQYASYAVLVWLHQQKVQKHKESINSLETMIEDLSQKHPFKQKRSFPVKCKNSCNRCTHHTNTYDTPKSHKLRKKSLSILIKGLFEFSYSEDVVCNQSTNLWNLRGRNLMSRTVQIDKQMLLELTSIVGPTQCARLF